MQAGIAVAFRLFVDVLARVDAGNAPVNVREPCKKRAEKE